MGDLISREQAIAEMHLAFGAKPAVHARAVAILKSLPSAEKTGRWKPFDLTWGRSIYACTACGEAFEVPTDMGKPIYDYCPNCGAVMVE